MAVDRGRVRRRPGVRFAKLFGTGRGFGMASADPTRWAALTVYEGPAPEFPGWDRLATSACRIDLRPIASRGRWSGVDPFASEQAGGRYAGKRPVVTLTRARLRASRMTTFWRAIGPVAEGLDTTPGLLAAFGFGEAPLGFQGTFSVWRDATDLVRFAYRHRQHQHVIERTVTTGWYAEDLFARFTVTGIFGDTEVIGWVEERQRSA
jgi:hypothetical protein